MDQGYHHVSSVTHIGYSVAKRDQVTLPGIAEHMTCGGQILVAEGLRLKHSPW